MAVTEGEFNALAEDLVKTLDEFKVPEKEKSELLAAIGPMKKDIVEKPGDMTTGTDLPANFKPAPTVEDESLYEEDVARFRRAYSPVSVPQKRWQQHSHQRFFSLTQPSRFCSSCLTRHAYASRDADPYGGDQVG